jgi:hypothetical protein
MFKISLTDTYTAPITVELPGSKMRNVFDAEFLRLSQPDVESLLSRIREGDLDDAGFCRTVVVGWKGVADDSGELEFSPAALDTLLSIYPVARCIVEGFFASLAGAKLKN